MASQQITVFDAWIHEVEEAMQLAEDIESRIRERDSLQAVGGDPNYVVVGARRKLMLLATKLDRLESLLHNPPAKPALTDVQDINASLQLLDKEKGINPNNRDISYLEGHIVKDKELLCSKVTEAESKHMAIAAEDKINLDIPLLDDVDKVDDSNQSLMCPMMQNGLAVVGRWFDGRHSTISLLLIAIAIVILVLIIFAVIESL